jgi:TldD protein
LKNSIDQSLKELGIEGLSGPDVQEVLSRALSNGGALAELFFEELHATRIAIEAGRLDELVDGIDRGVGLRILFDHRSVYGYTTELTRESLLKLASDLSAAVHRGESSAEATRVNTDWRPPVLRDGSTEQHQVVIPPKSVSIQQRMEYAWRGERAARACLPEARQVTSVLLDSVRKICTITSEGIVAQDMKTSLTYFCSVVAESKGQVQSSYEADGGYLGLEFFDRRPPEEIAEECARRVRILLEAAPAPAGTMPVVLAAEAGGTMIHEAVGHGLEADLACNGNSVYQGKVGQQVASPLITVVDDGTMPGRRGSYSVDDEGTPARKTVLIENGVLKSYLVDRICAMKFDLSPTGNGRRESFRHKPIVRMTNTYIAPGSDDPAQILADTRYGIFVKAMGGGQVNTVTGDFVFAVTEGYLIRDGKLGAPIRGATLVGNGPKVMMEVDRVGTDFGFAIGTCGKDGQGAPVTDAQPTIRIPALTVGGEVPMEQVF